MIYSVGLDTSALNPNFKEHALRGIGRYVFELNKFFGSYQSEKISVKPFRHEEFVSSKIDSLVNILPCGRQTIRQQILFPLLISAKTKQKFDLLHFPAHMDAPSWSMGKYVLTVLDLIPLIYADLYKANKPSWRFHLARWLEIRAIKNATHIITISHNTAKDVHSILGIPYERISVTHLGIDSSFFSEGGSNADIVQRYNLPQDRPLILYVGGIDQRKNLSCLVKAFKGCVDFFKGQQKPAPQLVLVGKIAQDRQYPKLQQLIKEAAVDEYVTETGYVPDEELIALYKASTVFFFPSLYEGFGLPPLEAMAAGLPVVSSNTSCLPEVLGDAAILVDPNDTAACTDALMKVLEDKEFAQSLKEKGVKQAAQFTWAKTGIATAAVYEKFAQ